MSLTGLGTRQIEGPRTFLLNFMPIRKQRASRLGCSWWVLRLYPNLPQLRYRQGGEWLYPASQHHRLTSEKDNRWQFPHRTCSYSSLHQVLTVDEPQRIAHTGVTVSSEERASLHVQGPVLTPSIATNLCIVSWEKRTDRGPKWGLLLVSL